jgi:biopolymer transport protein ExbD
MAIPPRRWVGYALVVAGLFLLFDTYTFLWTNWSPFHVPMYASSELALGYSLAVLGVVTLLAPGLIRRLDSYAPDASMQMGGVLAHESVEFRRERRLPLRRQIAGLPNLGLIGGPVILVLLIVMFVLVSFQESRGIYVRLVPRNPSGPDELCLAGPIVVTINQSGSVSKLLVNGTEVGRERLEQALKFKLAGRANWEVFIEGDDSVSFADPMYAIDVINDLHAEAVILTPKLKAQMAEKGCPLRQRFKSGVAVKTGLF